VLRKGTVGRVKRAVQSCVHVESAVLVLSHDVYAVQPLYWKALRAPEVLEVFAHGAEQAVVDVGRVNRAAKAHE
jgi:hypothetical protein